VRLTYLVVLIAMSAGGCATITSSDYQPISVSTYDSHGERLEKVRCVLQNDKGNWEVQAPGFAQVHRSSEDLLVQCKKDGQPDGSARAISRVGAGMFGNIIFGGGVGAIIDHTKGTAYNYPDALNIRMGTMAIFDRQDSDSAAPSGYGSAPAAQPVALATPAPLAKQPAKEAPGNVAADAALPPDMPRPGDLWKYRYVDGFSGTAKELFIPRVVAVHPDEIDDVLYVDGGNSAGSERAFTSKSSLAMAERPLRSVPRLEFGPYLQAFKPDLPFGSFGPFTAPAVDGEPWQFKGRLLGNEMVSVPAGTFDTMKIELSGTRGPGGGPPRASAVQARYVIWYAPKAKRYVKYEANTWNQYFQPLAKDRFELLEFKLN
jgi:hypothetical protein